MLIPQRDELRRVFEAATRLSDGQIRAFGLGSMLAGVLIAGAVVDVRTGSATGPSVTSVEYARRGSSAGM